MSNRTNITKRNPLLPQKDIDSLIPPVDNKTIKEIQTVNEVKKTVAPVNNIHPTVSVNNEKVSNYESLNIQQGIVLNSKYIVVDQLNSFSGEAKVFTVKTNNNEYFIAKIFKQGLKIKDEVLEKLKGIDSPYIEKIVDSFSLADGRFVEITPYYYQGTLDNNKKSVKELKEIIIPSLNEAINVLHQHNIVHMDIKPSNIMLGNDLKHVVLIDFGSAIIINDYNQIVISNNASYTPHYSAIETLVSNQCSIYSDYYSFGISLYEMLLGHSPFIGLTKEQIISFMQTNRIAFDDNVDLSMKDLILGLTYKDIANRNDYQNVNVRWSYKQVKDWLDGKAMVVPGEGILSNTNMIPFPFNDTYYTDINSLIDALALSWDKGIRQLRGKHLSNYFKNINHRLYEVTIEFESHFFDDKNNVNNDIEFFKYIYTILPQLDKFYYKGHVYQSIQDVGFTLLDLLDNKKASGKELNIYEEMLENGIFSTYCELKYITDSQLKELLHALEISSKTTMINARGKNKALYTLCYLLTGQKEYQVDGKTFKTIDEFADYINNTYMRSFAELDKLCKKLIYKRMLDIKLEAWLCSLGHSQAVDMFNQSINLPTGGDEE